MVESSRWNISSFTPYSDHFCARCNVHLHRANKERLQSWFQHEYVHYLIVIPLKLQVEQL